MRSPLTRHRRRHATVRRVALIVTLLVVPSLTPVRAGGQAPDVVVKAAFIFNFAKFTEWPALASGAPIVVCAVGDDGVASALTETVNRQKINEHPVEMRRPSDSAGWSTCHVLFIGEGDARRSAAALNAMRTLPVLTVSDAGGFATTGGIIGLYVEDGRMRFAINVDAADRAKLKLSSRLLGLAKIVRDGHGH